MSDTQLRQWLRNGSGATAARRLRNWMDDEGFDRNETGGIRANDVFWSWIAYSFEATTPATQRFSPDGADPVKHPRLEQSNWQAAVAHRCGWTLSIGGSRTRLFISLADRLLDWLRKRARAQTDTYVKARRNATQAEVTKKRPAEIAAHPDGVLRPDCLLLSNDGQVDCTRGVLQLAKQNLGDSFQNYGGAGTFWTAAVYLSLRGDIVGDIRRGSSYLASEEDIWMSESVDYLLAEGLIDCGLADRLMHRGAWETYTPPLPERHQKYVLDLFSGAMSLHYECMRHTALACVTVDYQRSTPQNAAGERCRYVRPHLILDIRHLNLDVVETVLSELQLLGQNLLHCHASPPCISHSTVNAVNRGRGTAYGLYGSLGEHCPMYLHDVASARSVLHSLGRAFMKWGMSYDVENPAFGTFKDLDFVVDLERELVDYCCYGSLYQKTTGFVMSGPGWEPRGTDGGKGDGDGRCHKPSSYKHKQCLSGRDAARRPHLPGMSDFYVKNRIPGQLFAEMLMHLGVVQDADWSASAYGSRRNRTSLK